MTECEIATKILQAMDIRNKAWKDERYEKSMEECFDDVFEGSVLGKLYSLAASGNWNQTEQWCNDVLKCEAMRY